MFSNSYANSLPNILVIAKNPEGDFIYYADEEKPKPEIKLKQDESGKPYFETKQPPKKRAKKESTILITTFFITLLTFLVLSAYGRATS